jgi:hypothetical protein
MHGTENLKFILHSIIGDKSSVFACKLDVHESMHHNTNLTEMTNKIQLCRTIYNSTVPWPLTYSMEQSPSWEANQWTLQLVKNFPAFMESESPSLYPQVPASRLMGNS